MSWKYSHGGIDAVDIGIGGGICLPDPDVIPSRPRLIFDGLGNGEHSMEHSYSQEFSSSSHARRNNLGELSLMGLPGLVFRNLAAYPYHNTSVDIHLTDKEKKSSNAKQHVYYTHRYPHFLPPDILTDLLNEQREYELVHDPIAEMGNVLAVADYDDSYFLFHPAGQVMQQASVMRCTSPSANDFNLCLEENRIETGANIKQMCLFGSEVPFAITRGPTNCTIIGLSNDNDLGENSFGVKYYHSLKFNRMVAHIACSPHVEMEAAFLTVDGNLRTWTSEDKIIYHGNAHPFTRWITCEYSSHPCVLWAANKDSIGCVDTRQKLNFRQECIYDLNRGGICLDKIFDIKRHPSDQYQVYVNTGSVLEIIDTRWSKDSVVSWRREEAQKNNANGPIDIVEVSTQHAERTLILQGSQHLKKLTAYCYSYEENNYVPKTSTLKLRDIRGGSEKTSTHCQALVTDVPLDIHIPDNTANLHLIGVGGINTSTSKYSSAFVFYSSTLGDIFTQKIQQKSEDDISPGKNLLSSLPCTFANNEIEQVDRNALLGSLPISSNAFLKEYDALSIGNYLDVPIGTIFQDQSPNVENARNGDININSSSDELTQDDPTTLMRGKLDQISAFVDSSCTLYNLLQFVRSEVNIDVDYSSLLAFLSSSSSTLQVHSCWVDSTKICNSRIKIGPQNQDQGDDKNACTCNVENHNVPCASSSCIIPHLIVIRCGSSDALVPSVKFANDSPYYETLQHLESTYGLRYCNR